MELLIDSEHFASCGRVGSSIHVHFKPYLARPLFIPPLLFCQPAFLLLRLWLQAIVQVLA